MAEWHSTKQTNALRTSISGDTHTALTGHCSHSLLDACYTPQARLFVCVCVRVLENNTQNYWDLETTRETHVYTAGECAEVSSWARLTAETVWGVGWVCGHWSERESVRGVCLCV